VRSKRVIVKSANMKYSHETVLIEYMKRCLKEMRVKVLVPKITMIT